MNKIFTIAIKDLLSAFRDTSSLVMMLVTPFALTLVIGFAFGGFGGAAQTGLSDISVYVVNHDTGQFGDQLAGVFESDDLSELISPTYTKDENAARAAVDSDRAAAAVIIPAGFSESVLPQSLLEQGSTGDFTRPSSEIEIYANPTRPNSAGVVRSIVDRFISMLAAGAAGGQTSIVQLLTSGRISPQEALLKGEELATQARIQAVESHLISVEAVSAEGQTVQGTDNLGYMAPSMAIIFLMFTVTSGGRTILLERQAGTLPRMLTTPLRPFHVLAGKGLGIFLTGFTQMIILITATTLLLNVRWGSPGLVLVFTAAVAMAAASWGMLLAAYSKTVAQAGVAGTALTLVFAGAAGNFVSRAALPRWLQQVTYVTPNAWGLEGYSELYAGGSLGDISTALLALIGMAAILLAVSALAFSRQYQ